MADVMRLENESASTTVNLIDDSNICIVNTGWQMSARPNDETVTDVLELLIQGGSKAAVRSNLNALVDILEDARRYHQTSFENESVWLRFASDGETAKRSLVYDYELEWISDEYRTPLINTSSTETAVRIAVTRGNWWEDVSDTTTSTSGTQWHNWNLSSVNGGNIPGRISRFTITTGGSNTADPLYIGIRPERTGGSNFQPFFNISTAADADTSSGSDGNAYGNTRLTTTFSANASLIERARDEPLGSAYADFPGRYLVILQASASNTTSVFGIQLGTSNVVGGGNKQQYPEVFFDSSDLAGAGAYILLELGEIEIPIGQPADRNVINLDWSDYSTHFSAERVSGTGSLYWGGYVLMPSEHFIKVDDMSSTDATNYIYTRPDGVVSAVHLWDPPGPDSNVTRGIGAPSPGTVWNYPHDGGRLIIVSDVTDDISGLSFEIKTRYRYRGYHT